MITIIIFGGDDVAIRFTKHRQLVFEVVKNAPQHVTADQVYGLLRNQGHRIGVATVYRNLNLLFEERLINRILHPDVGYLYDTNLEPHYHFHCEICNHIEDVNHLYQSEFDVRVEKQLHRNVFRHMTIFYGICKDCEAKSKD